MSGSAIKRTYRFDGVLVGWPSKAFAPTCCADPVLSVDQDDNHGDTIPDAYVGCSSCASDWFRITHTGRAENGSDRPGGAA